MAKKTVNNGSQPALTRLARIHFGYVMVFVAAIIIQDSWALITPQAVLERWTMAAVMLAVTIAIWFAARSLTIGLRLAESLVATFVALDIIVATFMVYAERGMASRGVALYAIPLVAVAVLRSRTALIATALVCVGAYTLTAVRYFVVNFNEGYRVELYSVLAFYCALFFVLAALLALVTGSKD